MVLAFKRKALLIFIIPCQDSQRQITRRSHHTKTVLQYTCVCVHVKILYAIYHGIILSYSVYHTCGLLSWCHGRHTNILSQKSQKAVDSPHRWTWWAACGPPSCAWELLSQNRHSTGSLQPPPVCCCLWPGAICFGVNLRGPAQRTPSAEL